MLAGIISFKIAVTALVTGAFSAVNAIEQFIVSTIIGILIGIIVGSVVVRLRIYLTANKGMKDNNTLTFIQLLTPFAVYFIAELFHASGIIAVVVAGLIHGWERDRLIRAQTELQMSFSQIWNTLSYALNGFVFVVLGFIVPEVVIQIIKVEPDNIKFLILISLLIALAIYVVRFIWVFLLYKDFYYPNHLQRYLEDTDIAEEQPPSRIRYAFIMTMCGIHGTISLSMALTLPTIINNHQTFEYRNDLLFIASLMVLISLILAQVVLPFITESEQLTDDEGMTYQSAKIFIMQAVITRLKELSEKNKDIDYRPVLTQYYGEMSFLINAEPDNQNTKELHRLAEIAEEEETATLERLINKGKINSQELNNYRNVKELTNSYKEASFVKKISRFFRMFYLRFKARKNLRKQEYDRFKKEHAYKDHVSTSKSNQTEEAQLDRAEMLKVYQNDLKKVQQILRIINHHIILRMQKEQNPSNVLEVSLVIDQYHNLSRALRNRRKGNRNKDKSNQNAKELTTEAQQNIHLQAIYAEREYLDALIKRNQLSPKVASQLRENIN